MESCLGIYRALSKATLKIIVIIHRIKKKLTICTSEIKFARNTLERNMDPRIDSDMKMLTSVSEIYIYSIYMKRHHAQAVLLLLVANKSCTGLTRQMDIDRGFSYKYVRVPSHTQGVQWYSGSPSQRSCLASAFHASRRCANATSWSITIAWQSIKRGRRCRPLHRTTLLSGMRRIWPR